MSIFKSKAPAVAEPIITGTQAIRQRVRVRMRRAHLARTASDLQIALPALEAFAEGKGQLSVAQLHLVTKEFYPNGAVIFDPEKDLLVDTNSASAVPFCTAMPEPYVNPDPAIAQAQAAYRAALAAARPPEPTRSPTPGQESAGRFAKRPGFAA